MRNLIPALSILLIAGLVGSSISCGDRGKGGGPSNGPAGGPPAAAPPGADQVALEFVHAVRAEDPKALASLSMPPLSEFWEAIARLGELQDRIVAFFQERYPDAARDHRPLELMGTQWRRTMNFMKDLELEGRLPHDGEDQVLYQIAYVNKHSITTHERLVIAKHDGSWKVESFGRDTPLGPHLGVVRTALHKYELSTEPALARVAEARPATLRRALEIFSQTQEQLLK